MIYSGLRRTVKGQSKGGSVPFWRVLTGNFTEIYRNAQSQLLTECIRSVIIIFRVFDSPGGPDEGNSA